MHNEPSKTISKVFNWSLLSGVILTYITLFHSVPSAEAHGISEKSRETMSDGGILDYIWLGAEHMLTGYDHLLFLFGVIFFLTGFRDVVRFITAFTIGHCITLLGATLMGITANAYLIDAVIALSVIYKGFENLKGFEKFFNFQAPNLLTMVFLFGLVHGFGLSTRLQELSLGSEGMVSRILAFNVGVEVGQLVALTVMLGVFAAWRASKSFQRFGTIANTGLVLAGVGLFIFQISGYLDDHNHESTDSNHHHEEPEHGAHSHDHHGAHNHGHEKHEQQPQDEAKEQDHGHEHGKTEEQEHGHEHKTDGSKHDHDHDKDSKDEEKKEKEHHHHKKDHGHSHGSGKEHSHGSGKKHKH